MEAETVKEETQKEAAVAAPAQASAAAPAPKLQEPVKRPRRDERNRKDDRSYDQFLKAVNAAPPGEQVGLASQKYLAMLEENKKMQFYIKQSDKRHALILKEKEQLQLEFNKAILLKSKLENLCRELQKQNKSIKDESLHKIREEEERRKETQAKFQTTLAEISALLQQNNEKNAKLRDDNISMTEKFKSVVQQYQIREDQVEKMSKQMELESQLNAAKMQKASLEHQAERERLTVEMETLRMAVAEYRQKVNEMQGTETGLRGQLAIYTDKYDEFQSALMKSNQVFGGFKDQMEKMSKKIKTLEKESLSWKQRWEASQSALLDMCAERQAGDARRSALQRQLQHMQSLCRALQAERTVLLGTLKEHDIERPPLPAPAPAPAPELVPASPAPSADSDAKVDAMAVNCAQLRQSLAHLQSQLNVLTTQQTQQADETAQPEKPKKNKNKKKSKKAAVEEPKVEPEATEEVNVEDAKAEEPKVEPEATEEVKVEDAVVEIEGVKETESIESKETNQPEEIKAEAEVDMAAEKVDEKVLENLMQAINIANVNLCDLEVVGDNEKSIQEVLDGEKDEITEPEAKIEVSNTVEGKENGVLESNEAVPEKTPEVPVSTIEFPKSSPKKNSSTKNTPKKNKVSPKNAEIEAKVENNAAEPVSNSNAAKEDVKSDNDVQDVEVTV